MSYNPKNRNDWVDKKLNLKVGSIQVIRTQFDRFPRYGLVSNIAYHYRLHPLLVRAIKEYRVWPDILPIGYES